VEQQDVLPNGVLSEGACCPERSCVPGQKIALAVAHEIREASR
jgi:hypothetical protein